jgi:hypothetical protein
MGYSEKKEKNWQKKKKRETVGDFLSIIPYKTETLEENVDDKLLP